MKYPTVVLVLLTISPLVFSYDQFEAGRVAGLYFGAADLYIRAKNSPCGYAIKAEPTKLTTRRDEILSYLKPTDRMEFANYMNSDDMQRKLARNQVMLDEMIARFSAETDKKTACGLVIGAIALPMKRAKDEWSNFITKNGLRPSAR